MSARDLPDARGHFDRFGGRFVPEALQAALSQLTGTFEAAVTDPDFLTELDRIISWHAFSASAAASISAALSCWLAPLIIRMRFCDCSSTKIGATPLEVPGAVVT